VTELAIFAIVQINPAKAKELNNIRAAGKDENVKLSPPRLVRIC
jgi:GTP-binding protein